MKVKEAKAITGSRITPFALRIANHAVVLAAILFGWFLVMAGLVRFLPVSDAYLALGPENRFMMLVHGSCFRHWPMGAWHCAGDRTGCASRPGRDGELYIHDRLY